MAIFIWRKIVVGRGLPPWFLVERKPTVAAAIGWIKDQQEPSGTFKYTNIVMKRRPPQNAEKH